MLGLLPHHLVALPLHWNLPARMVSIVAAAASDHARRIRADMGAKATAGADMKMDRPATGPATQSSGTLLTSCHYIRLKAIVFLFSLEAIETCQSSNVRAVTEQRKGMGGR